MNLFNKSLIFINFLSIGFLGAIATEFKLENKTNYRMYLSFGTSKFPPFKMNFFPLFPKEPYTQSLALDNNDYVWILLSKEVPTTGKKVLSVRFAPNKSKISVVVKNSTKNSASGLEVSSASIISSSNVAAQSDVSYSEEVLKRELAASMEEQKLKAAIKKEEEARKTAAEEKKRTDRLAADRKAAEAARIKAEQEKKQKAEEYEKAGDEIERAAMARARKAVENEFSILGLDTSATDDQIKSKYQQLLDSATSEEQKREITDAYNKIQRKIGF